MYPPAPSSAPRGNLLNRRLVILGIVSPIVSITCGMLFTLLMPFLVFPAAAGAAVAHGLGVLFGGVVLGFFGGRWSGVATLLGLSIAWLVARPLFVVPGLPPSEGLHTWVSLLEISFAAAAAEVAGRKRSARRTGGVGTGAAR